MIEMTMIFFFKTDYFLLWGFYKIAVVNENGPLWNVTWNYIDSPFKFKVYFKKGEKSNGII